MQGNTPKISVLMLTYNRADRLPRAIEAILAQTFSDFELVIVDNGSTDASGRVAENYALKDKRISVVHTERGSVGFGRNAALRYARGELVAFVDDDDYAFPGFLEFLHALLLKHEADISICGSMKEIGDELAPNLMFDECLVLGAEEAVSELLGRTRINAATATKMFKRDLFSDIMFPENCSVEDIAATYKFLASANKVVAHGVPQYCFSRHGGNLTSFTDDDRLLSPGQLVEYLAAFRERTEYLQRKLPKIGAYAQYSEWSYMISMCHKIISNKLEDCFGILEEVRHTLLDCFDEFACSPYIEEFEREYLFNYIK